MAVAKKKEKLSGPPRNYEAFLAVLEAQKLLNSYGKPGVMVLSGGGLFISGGELNITYLQNGHIIVHSNMWVPVYKSGEHPRDWPAECKWYVEQQNNASRKEYVGVVDRNGIRRFWLLPRESGKTPKGLLLRPSEELGWEPVVPVQDYRITVDRKLVTQARGRWEPFFNFIETIWNLMPEKPEEGEVQNNRKYIASNALVRTDRKSWHPYVQYAKTVNRGDSKRAIKWLREQVNMAIYRDDLPYSVELVPNTITNVTKYWDPVILKALKDAGRLDGELPTWIP